jgi:hypothetical protein
MTILYEHICTRIVPIGYSSMKQGKATRCPALRRKAKMLKNAFGYISIISTFGSAWTLNQLIKSRRTGVLYSTYGAKISSMSYMCGKNYPTCPYFPCSVSRIAPQLHDCMKQGDVVKSPVQRRRSKSLREIETSNTQRSQKTQLMGDITIANQWSCLLLTMRLIRVIVN